MNDSPNRKVAVFTEALELPVAERAAFLERACGSDAELRRQVELLLQAHDQSGDFLEGTGTAIEGKSRISVGEKPGDRIGRYKLLQQIGEGGCGVVFMAEQEEPVRRRVALKIIKPGMDTESVVARFEAERQALALMDHPNIAKVFDAGATESGRPYFVMELIRGIKITEYCDQNSLTTEDRLKLFVQVCQAVQHAHQKGVIHRDIKPSNILVTSSLEGAPLPVVIDFGIAKATTNQRLTDKTLFTAFEMLIGTPAYMSPEQAALTSADVDTRTDIYSLGVLLYELLTGSTPFDAGELLKAGLDEIRRVIQEQEPARPSTRLNTMAVATLTTVAQHRRAEPPGLIRSVRGDLDWVVMKALEKDRTRRYATANDLALDVKRILANEVISARPPSKFYRIQKIVLRNKTAFAGIAVIAILLVTSLAVVTSSLSKEKQARRKAQTEATKSQQVTRFLEDMLQGVGPSVALGRDTKMLREILDRTAEQLTTEMTNQPAVEAELRGIIGRLYLEIGNFEGSEKMHAAELALHRKIAGARGVEVAHSLNDLGNAYWKQRKLAQAEAVFQEALAIRRRLFGDTHADVAATLSSLGNVYRRQKKLAESEALTREALGIRRKLFGNEHLAVAESLRNLSVILVDRGKRDEAKTAARETLAMRRRLLGNEHPLVAAAVADLAWVTGGSAEADSLESEAFIMRQKMLGDNHPDVANSIYSLGDRMREQGKLAEADAVLNAALSIQRKLVAEDHPDVLATLRALGRTLQQQKKWPEAEAAHRQAAALWRKRSGNGDPEVRTELEHLTRVLIAQKKFEEAEQALSEVLTPEFIKKPASVNLLTLRIDLRGRRGRLQEAAADAALALEHQPNGNDHYCVLATILAKMDKRAEYADLCRRFFETFGETTNLYVADQLAKTCLLLPSGVDLKALDRLADTALAQGASDKFSMPFFQVCKALSEYRQGNFAAAIEWGQKPLKSSSVYSHSHAYGVLAMAHWGLGEKEAAQRMLEKGNELSPPVIPARDMEDPGKAWLAWLFARIALDEAAALLGSRN